MLSAKTGRRVWFPFSLTNDMVSLAKSRRSNAANACCGSEPTWDRGVHRYFPSQVIFKLYRQTRGALYLERQIRKVGLLAEGCQKQKRPGYMVLERRPSIRKSVYLFNRNDYD